MLSSGVEGPDPNLNRIVNRRADLVKLRPTNETRRQPRESKRKPCERKQARRAWKCRLDLATVVAYLDTLVS